MMIMIDDGNVDDDGDDDDDNDDPKLVFKSAKTRVFKFWC